LEMNNKGEIGLSENKMDYYNGDDILFLEQADNYQENVAILNFFIYKKSILLAPGEHINIDLKLLLEDEYSFLKNGDNLRKYSGFKLLLLKNVEIHDLDKYKNLTGLGTSDYFISPDDSVYETLGIAKQIGFYEKDGIEYDLCRDIEILREKYIKRYNEVYVNSGASNQKISFMVIARRPSSYNYGTTQEEKRISFKLNVFSDSAKISPFYYKKYEAIIPYLKARTEKDVISSVTDISYLLKKRKLGRTETNIDNLVYGNVDSLSRIIDLGNNEFSIGNPPNKNKLQSNIVYYSFDDIEKIGYISYLYRSIIIVKIASPYSFYKIQVPSNNQEFLFKKVFKK